MTVPITFYPNKMNKNVGKKEKDNVTLCNSTLSQKREENEENIDPIWSVCYAVKFSFLSQHSPSRLMLATICKIPL